MTRLPTACALIVALAGFAAVAGAAAPNQPGGAVVEVICRDAWGAKAPRGEYERHVVSKVTIHHQGAVFTDSRRAAARMRTMQAYHQSARQKFVDIAYHFVIDPDGNVYEGRPTWAAGETRTDYDPRGHLLVGLLGNFEEQQPTARQLDTLARMSAWAADEFGVAPTEVRGHRDYARTLCPGKSLERLIRNGSIAARVEALRRDDPTTLKPVCGSDAAQRLNEIQKGR